MLHIKSFNFCQKHKKKLNKLNLVHVVNKYNNNNKCTHFNDIKV